MHLPGGVACGGPQIGPEYTDPTFSTVRFIVDQPYKIAALALDPKRTAVSSGSFGDIRFTLSPSAPDTFFVQAASGTIFGTFDEPGQFRFSVMAVDASGKAAEVEKLSFDVLPKPQFKIATTNARARTASMMGSVCHRAHLKICGKRAQ